MVGINGIMFLIVFVGLSIGGIVIGVKAIMKSEEVKNPLLDGLEEDKNHKKKNGQAGISEKFASNIEKNNKLVSSWDKTETMQNQLKLMQASAEGGEKT